MKKNEFLLSEFLYRVFLCSLLLVLAGCASTSRISLSDMRSLQPDEQLIFGRVHVVDDEKTINWGKELFGQGPFEIVMLNLDSSDAVFCPLTGDGTFFWRLRPARYAITSFRWQHILTRSGRIYSKFTVPQSKHPVYIGTLKIRFLGNAYTHRVVDEEDEAVRMLKEHFSETVGPVTKSLLVREEGP